MDAATSIITQVSRDDEQSNVLYQNDKGKSKNYKSNIVKHQCIAIAYEWNGIFNSLNWI